MLVNRLPLSRARQFRLPPTHRLLLWGFRALVVAVLLLLLLLGVRDVIRQVLNSSNNSGTGGGAVQGGFPQAAAKIFAARFALAYATFDSDHPADHQNALRAYLASGADPMLGWDGQGKETASQALLSGIDVSSSSQATIRVAVGVNNGRWLYLAVPVSSDGNNQLVISGSPALLSPPTLASAPAQNFPPDDPALAAQLNQPMSDFFTAYAASSPSQLNYYAVPGKSFEGLHGSVIFNALPDLHIAQDGGDQRQASAMVKWSDPASKASLTQNYHLTLQLVGGQWHVSSVTPGGS
ncbi:MAG: conjugal transfer protein [Candidatus Dormibacteraceae bacterium]